MNFIAGKLVGAADDLRLVFEGLEVAIPPERSRRLAQFAGRDITCGIRPEDMHDPAFVRSEVRGQPIEATVDVTEMMGNERFLHLIVSGHRVLARVDARSRARAGNTVQLLLDLDRVHIFDAVTEKALDKIDLPDLPIPSGAATAETA